MFIFRTLCLRVIEKYDNLENVVNSSLVNVMSICEYYVIELTFP
jgi:hypothetical protein